MVLAKLPKPTTPEEKRLYKQEKKRRRKLSKPLTPEQRNAKNQLRRMKDRARILSIMPLGNGRYQVWGGENAHIVTVSVDGEAVCDCLGFSHARNGNCSHVTKYRLVYGDLKK